MDHHRELYKKRDNDFNFKRLNLVKENRAKQRADNFQKTRPGFETSPGFEDKMAGTGKPISLVSSTPMVRKKPHIEKDKENIPDNHDKPLLTKEEKRLKREAYKKKFMAWKAEKRQQQELEKQNNKPKPFIPCGTAKTTNQTAAASNGASSSSFAPNNHQFRPPTGLKDPKIVDIRHSIYVVAETPPRNKTTDAKQKSTELKSLFSKNKIQWIGGTKTNSSAPFSSVRTESEPPKKIVNGMKSSSEFIPTNSTATTSNNIAIGSNKKIPLTKPTTQTKNNPKPNLKATSVSNGLNNLNAVGPKLAPTTNVGATNSKGAIKKVADVAKPQLKAKPTTQSTNVTTGATSTGAAGKAKLLQKKKDIMAPPPAQRNKVTKSAKLAVSLKPKKTLKRENVAAAAVAIAMKANDNCKPQKPLKTPTETGNPQDFGLFTTSTQLKTISGLTSNSLTEFTDLCKTISPVEALHMNYAKANDKRNLSVKRAILQDEGMKEKRKPSSSSSTSKPTKFNFVKKYQLETTMADGSTPGRKSKNSQNKKEEKEEEKRNPSIDNDVSRSKVVAVKKRFRKTVNSLEKMESIKQLMKSGKEVTPQKSLEKKAKDKTPKSTKEKPSKFNFVKRIELETTVVEKETGVAIAVPPPSVTVSETKNSKLKVKEREEEILKEEESPKTPEATNNPIERPINYLSPFVSVSRGKVSARKEREKRNSIYLQETPVSSQKPIEEESKAVTTVEDLPPVHQETTPETVEKRRAVEAVRYFRQQLADETCRLLELCGQWEDYKNEHMDLIQESNGDDMIHVTIGQTKLLTSKKFMQFKGLIDRCEAHANGTAPENDGSEDTKPISAVDLEGFWSMLGLQVENIEKRFQNLDRWKENNWQDPDAVNNSLKPRIASNLNKVRKAKKVIAKKGTAEKPQPNKALREMMMKMKSEMQAKKKQEQLLNEDVNAIAIPTVTLTEPPVEMEPQIEGFPPSALTNCSPRHTRRSSSIHHTEINKRNSLSNTPGRICIVVPDRRSRSIVPTVISVPSPPIRKSPLGVSLAASVMEFQHSAKKLKSHCESNDLLKTAVFGAGRARRIRSNNRRRNSLSQEVDENCGDNLSADNKRELTPSPSSRSPGPGIRKSILKTPGTAKRHTLSVVFNEHTSVKKFRPLRFDEQPDEEDDGDHDDVIEQGKIKSAAEILPPIVFDLQEEEEKQANRSYCLRTRRIKLRPSSEIEIP